MRDIVNYLIYRTPDSPGRLMEDSGSPDRQEYLEQFADKEGKVFLNRFYSKYQGKAPDEVLDTLMHQVKASPRRLAAAFRALNPQATLRRFKDFVRARVPHLPLTDDTLERMYRNLDQPGGSRLHRAHPSAGALAGGLFARSSRSGPKRGDRGQL
jgi:hypothetical protein